MSMSTPRSCHQGCVAQLDRAAADAAAHTDSGYRFEAARLGECQSTLRASATMASASGCSLPWSRLAASRSTSASAKPVCRNCSRKAGRPRSAFRSCRRPACRSCAAARSPRHRGTRCRRWRRVRSPTMIDIGVARPSAQGQAMISTATALTSRESPARLRPEQAPGDEASARRSPITAEHEPARDLVGHALHRRARSLRLGHHLHDLREHCLGADLARRA